MSLPKGVARLMTMTFCACLPGISNATIITLDVPGALNTYLYGVNDVGQVVGNYNTLSSPDVAVLLQPNGSYVTLDYPDVDEQWSSGRDINNAGVIVGFYSLGGWPVHGFLRTAEGVFATIEYPGAAETIPNGINDSGEIVGEYTPSNGPTRGFYRDAAGAYFSFELPGATNTRPEKINNAGVIAGVYDRAGGGGGGFVGTMATGFVDVLVGGVNVLALGINDAGDIVGSALGGALFLSASGEATIVGNATQFNDITNRGVVAGFYWPGGPVHGIYGQIDSAQSPLPEPTTLWLLGSGLLSYLGLGISRRRPT